MGGQNYKIAEIFQRDIAYYQGNHGGGPWRRWRRAEVWRRIRGGDVAEDKGVSGLDHWLAGARKIAQPGVAGALVIEEVVE